MTRVEQIVLSLVRSALCGEPCPVCSKGEDWNEVYTLALKHGVGAISFDGIQECYATNPDSVASLESTANKALKYDWFGIGISTEIANEDYRNTIASLADIYAKAGIKMMLLKGYGLSLDYPIPGHRPVGDIDVYLYGLGKQADEAVKLQAGVAVKQNGDKHSTFKYEGITVENHASFINAKVHPSLLRLEMILESEAANGIPLKLKTEGGDAATVYLPSHIANALFLPFHCASHFVHGEALLRQICDWACFVRKYGKEINWDFVWTEVEAAGYGKFYCCLNGIVEQYLGVPRDVLPSWPRYSKLQEIVLAEIFKQGPPKKLSFFGKILRYFASCWRYKLVFRESMISTFFRQARSYFRLKNESAKSLWER